MALAELKVRVHYPKKRKLIQEKADGDDDNKSCKSIIKAKLPNFKWLRERCFYCYSQATANDNDVESKIFI